MVSSPSFLPVINLNGHNGTAFDSGDNRNSRFFSFDTSSQAINLGLSFNIPFISIPTEALLNFGQQTTSALSEIISMNLPSIAMAVIVVGAAILFLPKVMGGLMGLMAHVGLPGAFKTGDQLQIPTDLSSYSNYLRSLEAGPLSSILDQIDSAFQDYQLDSTACLQRVVCQYVGDAEAEVKKGTALPSQLVIKGIARSAWVQNLVGDNALSEALEAGTVALGTCAKRFPKCPFSLPKVLRFLASYATARQRK